MNYPKKELAQLVIGYCVANEVEDVVISPGSRNAPLTIGFSNHPKVKTYSIVDERCAAFFAMGIAQQKKKPVCIVCTSGSALLNYYPAVAEAYYSDIPLVVISADRPKHKIDIGDGQTIRQENVFKNHSLFNANLVEHDKYISSNASLINEALLTARLQKGPVHINVPFEEPLYELTEKLEVEVLSNNIFQAAQKDITETELSPLVNVWNGSNRKMILIGSNYPDAMLQDHLAKLVDDPSVLVFTETTSNVHHENFVNSIDKLIMPLDEPMFAALKPDILITLGGMIVSKKIKQFLRAHQPKHHWHIDEKKAPNTFFCLEKNIKSNPTIFFKSFIPLTERNDSDYQGIWLDKLAINRKRHQEYLADIMFSDLKAFNFVLDSLPKAVQLQLGNSSIVRYAQLFDVNKTLEVFCNRGTSGIDGCTSTAIGAATASEKQTVFISGDVSFFYDANALWNVYIPRSFRIIIINNDGGGIFRVIPGPTETNALEYFETPHALTAEHLCEMHQIEYFSARNESELEHQLKNFYDISEHPKLLEICTPSEVNAIVLKDYFKYLS